MTIQELQSQDRIAKLTFAYVHGTPEQLKRTAEIVRQQQAIEEHDYELCEAIEETGWLENQVTT